MSESAHTPGPWSISPVTSNTIDICSDAGTVAQVWPAERYSPGQDPINRANAHLIAAAPDMLAACEAALEHWVDGDDPGAGCETQHEVDVARESARDRAVGALRFALAKAKGVQQ